MLSINCMKILTETSVEMVRADVLAMSEAAQIQVTDDVLTGMFKFITDKYNALDFGEIEKSSGNIAKFKYYPMLRENVETLRSIYAGSSDPGAAKYVKVCDDLTTVMNHLYDNAQAYQTLYQKGNGVIQLLYTSMVAACIYCIGTLVSNTIRFVTSEKDTECEVLFEEIPGTIKHLHIKNITSAANDIGNFNKLLSYYSQEASKGRVNESISLASFAAAGLGAGIVIMLIPSIISLIREIIYSIYFNRVKMAEMLGVQADLIRTNIESLEKGRGNAKIIAKQKKIVDKLVKWQNRIAVKSDAVNSMVKVQKNKENTALRVDRNSPIVRDPDNYDPSSLML